jgi:hypothetical protein
MGLWQLHAGHNIMGELPKHVPAHGLVLENVALGPGPPYPAGELANRPSPGSRQAGPQIRPEQVPGK